MLKRIALLLAVLPLHCGAAVDVLSMWDFARPEVSEARFREATKTATADDAAILQTQIARTYGLRRRFDEARALLAELQPRLAGLSPEAQVRYHLELGRTHASATHRAQDQAPQSREIARAAFLKATELARANRLDYLAVDALHMMAFVHAEEAENLKWTQQALDEMLKSSQPDARKWETSLRNNIGYSMHKLQRYDEALAMFQANIPALEKTGNARRVRIGHWMVAWTLRAMGRLDEAIAIQLRLEQENAAAGAPDQYVFEELKALYEMKGDADKARHYAALHAAHK